MSNKTDSTQLTATQVLYQRDKNLAKVKGEIKVILDEFHDIVNRSSDLNTLQSVKQTLSYLLDLAKATEHNKQTLSYLLDLARATEHNRNHIGIGLEP